jgi:hypothetical protein
MVFNDQMLKPELQSMDDFVDGINNIAETHQKVAAAYIKDGSVEGAIPPLKALLYIMAEGTYEGKTAADPEIRGLFDREYVLGSDWYRQRLELYRDQEVKYLEREIAYLEKALKADTGQGANIQDSLSWCRREAIRIQRPDYLDMLVGTIGRDVIYKG